jgi:hypothetical protein
VEVDAVPEQLFPSSSSGMDSQSKVVADKLKGGHGVCFSRACAGSLGTPNDLLGSSASSSSSQGPTTHTALVELCCGSASQLSAAALEKGMRALRVTQQSHDLLTEDGDTMERV